MFVPMPIKTNEPTKITASAMAPNRVQKVILSRSSIMLGSLLRVSWSRARLIVYQFTGSQVDRPGVPRSPVLPAEHERRPGPICPASSRRSGVRGTGPLRGLPGYGWLNAVGATYYLMVLRATIPPATSSTPTPNAKIGVRLPPDCGSDLPSAALTASAALTGSASLTASAPLTADSGAGAGAGTGAGAAFDVGAGEGAGTGGETGTGGGDAFFSAPPEADADWLTSCTHSVASSGLRLTEEPPSSNVTSPPSWLAASMTPIRSCALPVWATDWIGAHWLELLLPVTEND